MIQEAFFTISVIFTGYCVVEIARYVFFGHAIDWDRWAVSLGACAANAVLGFAATDDR
jgi:hypothetical protein